MVLSAVASDRCNVTDPALYWVKDVCKNRAGVSPIKEVFTERGEERVTLSSTPRICIKPYVLANCEYSGKEATIRVEIFADMEGAAVDVANE